VHRTPSTKVRELDFWKLGQLDTEEPAIRRRLDRGLRRCLVRRGGRALLHLRAQGCRQSLPARDSCLLLGETARSLLHLHPAYSIPYTLLDPIPWCTIPDQIVRAAQVQLAYP
jgi:hypothetical protein